MPNPLFHVSSGLLDPEHVKAIGPAIWTYLVLIDWQTDPGGKVRHLQKGGIRSADIARRLGISDRAVLRHLRELRRHGYIQSTRTREGFFVSVRKPKKRFRPDKTVQSRPDTNSHPDQTKVSRRPDRNGQSLYKDDSLSNQLTGPTKWQRQVAAKVARWSE